jgi:hypothetical protein
LYLRYAGAADVVSEPAFPTVWTVATMWLGEWNRLVDINCRPSRSSRPGRLWRDRRVIVAAGFAAVEAASRTAKNWRNMGGFPFIWNASPCLQWLRSATTHNASFVSRMLQGVLDFFRGPIDGRVTGGLAALGDLGEATATSLKK